MISYLLPTICRSSLSATLNSIETYPGDEIVIVTAVKNLHMQGFIRERDASVYYCERGNDWGHSERNFAMRHGLCKGQYIAHIDDDDVYAPGARAAMADAIQNHPGRPIIFRMQFPCGITLWQSKTLACGNVGTPMMLTPNDPEKFGFWAPYVGGDFNFIETSKWTPDEYVWREEIVALLGHDPGQPSPVDIADREFWSSVNMRLVTL